MCVKYKLDLNCQSRIYNKKNNQEITFLLILRDICCLKCNLSGACKYKMKLEQYPEFNSGKATFFYFFSSVLSVGKKA